MAYTAILLPIVLTSANNQIRLTEGAGTNTATIAAGTYFLRGDGSSDDLCRGVKLALEAAGASANTYTVSLFLSANPAAPTATVSIARTGGDTFALLFADILTTFDPFLLGYPETNTSNNSSAKGSTLSPSSLWVADADTQDVDFYEEAEGYFNRANSGVSRDGVTGGPFDCLALSWSLIDGKRAHSSNITADPFRAFNKLWAQWIAGRPCEIHFVDPTSWPSLGSMSSATRQGTRWHIGEDGRDRFRPPRFNRATSLYSFDVDCKARVT